MGVFERLESILRIRIDDPELVQSQLSALTRQIPLMYFILIVNSIGLATTHYHSAPVLLTLVVPGVLTIVCSFRAAQWLTFGRRVLGPQESAAMLRRTVKLSAALSVGFIGWALSLYGYGSVQAQGHVAFYIAITVIGCIFCLMHLPPAAMAVTLIVVPPFVGFFVLTGDTVFIAIAVNLLLVGAAMVVILLTYYKDFSSLIESKKQLLARQKETQRLSDENFRLANRDSLTGLPNRRRFFADLDAKLARSAVDGSPFAVGMIDLDGFKPVNDVYGHIVGDRLLIEAGRRLTAIAGPDIVVARLGGDEFGLIIEGEWTAEGLTDLGRRLCEAIQLPYVMPEVTARVSGSMGFATHPEAGDTAEELSERADYALYHAKQNQRGAAVIFSEVHETEIRQLAMVEQSLRQADLDRELSVVFQPLVDVVSGRTIALEALARWTSPTLGPVEPACFIRVAERSDLIGLLTASLLRRALAAARDWPDDVRIAFNLSTRDVVSCESVLRLVAIVEASGVAAKRIDFEVTETALMHDFEQARTALELLRRTGARIALDDFGTGSSSLSCVHRLPLDKIKIDRGFVADIERDPTARAITRTVVDLCRNLGLECVVEGVETEAQCAVMLEAGCNVMQGFLLGRPLDAEDVAARLLAERLMLADRAAVA